MMPVERKSEADDEFQQRWLGLHTGRRARMAAGVVNDLEPPSGLVSWWMRLRRLERFNARRRGGGDPATTPDEVIWCLVECSGSCQHRGRKPRWLGLFRDRVCQARLDAADARAAALKRSDRRRSGR